MVSDTRSAHKSKHGERKRKDEEEGSSSKKKVNTKQRLSVPSPGKADVAGIKRSVKETSVSRHTMPSPQSTRKSKRLEKETPPLTPPVKRISERLGKFSTPSPSRRSDRGMKKLSPGVSAFQKSAKELKLPEPKRKKEKTFIQVTVESQKAEPDLEGVGMKRKKMNGRSFKALFKKQHVKEIVADGDGELEGQDKSSHVCSDNSRCIGSWPNGNDKDDNYVCSRKTVGELKDESIGKASDGAEYNPIYSSKSWHADTENDINLETSLRENNLDEPCSKYSQNSSSVRESFNGSERSPTNRSSSDNMDAPELGSSPYLEKRQVATPSASPTCENHNLLGTCVQCSKNKRVGYDSPKQELCSCSPMVDKSLGSFSICKDRSDHGGAGPSESAGVYDCRHSSTEMQTNSQFDGCENVCAVCNKDGELLFCEGKSCKRSFHLCCLDPPLTDAFLGVWYCPQCVKKKLLFGVHSVSQGIELICDVREVEVSNAKEVRQKQYLVKYHGLAHIHNLWVTEKQLLLENPGLVSNFSKKDQNVKWNAEWTVPHRLLVKRSIQDKIYIASSVDISVCSYEWLVKWHGLTYDHATWELDNADFLSSSVGQSLVKDYETRRQKARQEADKCINGSILNLSEFRSSQSLANKNYMLKNVNRLRECFFQCQNAAVLDDQERAMTVILFIQSLSEFRRPFLIVTTSSLLSQWEAEFARLASSVNVVVYSGNRDTRKGIRASEFYEEQGCVMLEVLLSSAEAVFEDLDILSSIRWEAIVIDDYQHIGISRDLEQIKMLTTNSRILMVGSQIKDTTSEYLKTLSLLESPGDFDKPKGLKSETSDSLSKLKDRLSRFVAYGSTSQVSKFLEYWIPVQLSNYQLEQYCDTLLSNSIPLRSCLRNDQVGVLQDTLLTVRKCCDHPYLLDSSVQGRLIDEKCSIAELLDIGIKVSGKLQLLDKMLTEIKTRGLKVLILFQSITGSGGTSIGHILDDFLRQRFGELSYERVDHGLLPSKRQAAVNKFNEKQTGQFASFLLENRACGSSIKLSSLDVVIIYDSDWNPATDLKLLQKIWIDAKREQIKVFRLYSSFTVEEGALIQAKQNLNKFQNVSRSTNSSLLSWGATHLFSKLDEYHANNHSTSDLNFSSEDVLCNEVIKEFQTILSGSREDIDLNPVISEVKLGVASYSTNCPLLGEAKVQFKDGEEPHVFWRNLLQGKSPQWIHLKAPNPRKRKRVNYLDASPRIPETEKDDVAEKRKKVVIENLGPALVHVELEAHKATQVASSNQGPSAVKACDHSKKFQEKHVITANSNPNSLSGLRSVGAEVSVDASDERIVSVDEQKSLHDFLQGETMRLCQTLNFSEDASRTVRCFLEYVISNHHINSDSTPIVQAFQISVCWIAASIMKQKVNKKGSLMFAKQLLNYQCTEEQVNSVYSKMRSLKRMYLQHKENTIDSGRVCLSSEEDISRGPSEEYAGEKTQKAGKIDSMIKKKKEKCDKRMRKLTRKQQEEIQKFHQTWEEKRLKLEADHKLESAFIRSVHGQGPLRTEKLKLLEYNFAKKIEEHNLLKDAQLKNLEEKHLASMSMVVLLNQSKPSSDHGNMVSGNLPDPVGQDSDEVQPLDLTEDFPIEVPKTVPGHVEPVELSDASKKKSDEESRITLPDVLVHHIDADEESSGDLHTPGHDSAQTVTTPGGGDLLQPQVRQDKSGQSSVSPQLHGQDVSPVELQSTSRIGMRTSELIDTVSELPYNVETSATGEVVAPVPVTEDPVELHPVHVSIGVSCNPSAAIKDHDQSRISSQTAELGGREVLPHVSVSLGAESMQIHSNHGQSAEPSRISENDMGMPQVVTTSERPNRAVPQLGIDAGYLRGGSYAIPPLHVPRLWNSTASLPIDPFENELERMRKETEELEKIHQDMMSQLKSDCEREIREIIAQIRKKYELRSQEVESEFRLKRNEFDRNQNKVLMNKKLAEAFRFKCQDSRPSALPGSVQQGLFNPPSQSPSMRPSSTQPGPTYPSSQPGSTRPAHQTSQQQQQLSRSHSSRARQPDSVRPPVISAITPAGNPYVGGEVRQPAPHLQYRPARPAPSTITATSTSAVQLRPSSVLPSHPPPPEPSPLTNVVSNLGLVMDKDNLSSAPLPDIISTFHELELSEF